MSKMSKSSPRLILNSIVASMATASVLGLGGCGVEHEEPKVDATVYQTLDQCVADGNPSNLCSKAMSEAKAEAAKTAPHYDKKEDCEQDWGSSNCGEVEVAEAPAASAPVQSLASSDTTAPVHHSSGFSPFMWGYMMGHNNGTASSAFAGSAQPVYRSYDNYLHTGGGVRVSPGRSMVPGEAFGKVSAPAHFSAGNTAKASGGFHGSSAHGSSSGHASGFGHAGSAHGMSVGG